MIPERVYYHSRELVRLINVDSIILYTARGALFSTWQIFEGFDSLFRAEVDDKQMRRRSPLLRLPIG